MNPLYTEADLAEILRATPRMVADWRREFGWPCEVFKRRVRFTQAHVDHILASHECQPASTTVVPIAGQTRRSAGRSR